ncbi:MAG: M28 family peptidase [Saprospiraceae bacterium]|nr:M28 family peptidase [Saprospiraceae bacterium]
MKSQFLQKSLILFTLLSVTSLCAQKNIPEEVKACLEKASGDAMKAHIAYLADDALLGRLPGTPGFETAVQYVESQYKKLGLTPAGEQGTYRQKVMIRSAKPDAAASSLVLKTKNGEQTLEPGKDYVFRGDFNQKENSAEAPVVFAGFGIDADKIGHNDYKNLDVKGKIVILLDRVPEDKFGSTETAHLGRQNTKLDMAYKHGAVGVLLLPSINVGNNNFSRSAEQAARGARGVVLPNVKSNKNYYNPYPALKFVASLSWEGLGKLMGQPDKSAKELAAILYNSNNNVTIPGTLKAHTVTSYEEIESYNVIGKIPGVDSKLKNEYVVHTAHLDHVGVGRPIEGDSIYNGAHDNASGVASLLEIAKLYTQLKNNKPKRSILFVMVTAEEMGLLGSLYFSNNPTVPKDKIVADVNTDMPTLIAPLLGVVPLGAEHSSLMDNVKSAANQLGLEVMQDHMPQEVRFVRSDQYNFVLQGIPALHIKYGLKAQGSSEELDAKIKDFTQNHYHKPSDELNDSFNFEGGQTYVKLNFLISYLTATDPARPTWNKDSIFAQGKWVK